MIGLVVNGRAVTLPAAVPRDASLLEVLRNDLALNSPKYGCGLGECGACTVWVDGIAARACVVPLGGVAGRRVTTLEGLADADGGTPRGGAVAVVAVAAAANGHHVAAEHALSPTPPPPLPPLHLLQRDQPLHPLQQAFIDTQAAQCGYCIAGIVMTAAALLAHEPRPSEARVRAALAGNLCRCGTHVEIVAAVMLAVRRGAPAP